MRYPVSLAILDYAPVLLTLAGQCLLVLALPEQFSRVYGVAVVGALLIFSGGFLKATWKTIIAVTEKDIRWMEHSLFLLLTPGACLFAWASCIAATAPDAPPLLTLAVPLLPVVVLFALCIPRIGNSAKWFLPLVPLLTIAMGVLAYFAYSLAQMHGEEVAAWLFAASFMVSLVTAGLSRKAATIAMQWFMEISNTVSAALFLFAAYLLN